MSYYSTAAITSLLGGTVAPGGTEFRITQEGNNRITQAGNRRITQAGSATGVILSASGFAVGASTVVGVGASSSGGNTDQLISQWTFNSDAHDSRGAHDGTLVGSPTFVPAKLTNGVLLNASGTQYVDIGDVAEFVGLSRTYAGWVRFDANTATRTLFSKISGTTGILLQQFTTSVNGYFNSGTAQLVGAGFVASIGELAHVALVLDNTSGPPFTARLYKNGVQIATGSYTAITNPSGTPFLLGRQSGQPTRDFLGVLDDWRVYNYPLTPDEVRELADTGGGVGPLEPVDSAYVQVDIRVGTAERQTWDGFGWGAGAPSDVDAANPNNLTQYVDNSPNNQRLFSDLNTKVLRLVNPLYPNFVNIHKPLVDLCVAGGVDRIMALGFVHTSPGYTGTALANAIDAAMDAGIPITHANIQNEPDAPGGGNWPGETNWVAEVVAITKELRARLNALGRSSVKITGCEFAKFSQANLSEYDGFAAEPAGFIGPSGTITRGAGHCYRGCPTDQDYDQRYATKGVGLWSGETGNGGVPHTGARFISGLNHGVEVEVHHAGQTVTNQPTNTQCLVRPDGTVEPQWGQYRIITPLLTRGSIFRLCTCNDGVANGTILSNGASLTALQAVVKQRMLRTFGTQNPRINVACCKRPDDRWFFCAVNTTFDPEETSNFINAHYGAAPIQLTVTIPELAGTNAIWAVKRCSSVGGTAGITDPAPTVNMQNGTMRFKLAPSETISLLTVNAFPVPSEQLTPLSGPTGVIGPGLFSFEGQFVTAVEDAFQEAGTKQHLAKLIREAARPLVLTTQPRDEEDIGVLDGSVADEFASRGIDPESSGAVFARDRLREIAMLGKRPDR